MPTVTGIDLASNRWLAGLVAQAMTVTIDDVAWFDRAGCSGRDDHDRWYPTRQTPKHEIRETRRICGACPVRAECLGWAFASGDWHGIWGGYTADERRVIKRQWVKLDRGA